MKKIALIVLLVVALAIPTVFVFAEGNANVCPSGGGWIKIDGLSGYSYAYTAPEGYEISASCYKASNAEPVHETYDPPVTSVTITSEVINPGGQLAELSHVAFQLVKIVTPTSLPTLTPPVEETPTLTPPVEETPTLTPPVEETPTVTPPVGETPTVTPPVEETPTVTPPIEETPTPRLTETPSEIITTVQTGSGSALPFLILLGFGGAFLIWTFFRSRITR